MAALAKQEYDVIIVGTGAAALTGAITARAAGVTVLLLEKTDRWGGTSAYSGGGVWIPDNPFVREHGLPDSFSLARQYLDRVVGDGGPASSPERRTAFLREGPKMVSFLRELGMEWAFKTNFPDYYPDLPGAGMGRGLGCDTIDGRRLGAALDTMRKPVNYPPLVFSGSDMAAMLAPFRKLSNLAKILKILAVSAGWKLSGRIPLSMGRATMGELMLIAQRLGIEMLLNAEVDELVFDGDRVTGVSFVCDGERRALHARRGVLIASGGFAWNDKLRRTFQSVGSDYTAAAPGDSGMPIWAAKRAGARLELMNESWWMPVVLLPDGSRSITLWERSMPHSIIVDQKGDRCMNEAQPYNDCGRRILERGNGAHSWLIIDSRHRRNYAFTTLPAAWTPKDWLESGFFIKASNLEELAQKTGVDNLRLRTTIDRFNRFAQNGLDEDFGRGGNSFDNSWGDRYHRPNPNLGSIGQPPYYAVRIYPGDIGTKGGLLTDELGRVVSESGVSIPGLYAAGNSTASMMGGSYPGAGGTLGPAMVFAYIGMRHLAQENSDARGEPLAEKNTAAAQAAAG